jgi:hypothetical protein
MNSSDIRVRWTAEGMTCVTYRGITLLPCLLAHIYPMNALLEPSGLPVPISTRYSFQSGHYSHACHNFQRWQYHITCLRFISNRFLNTASGVIRPQVQFVFILSLLLSSPSVLTPILMV